MTHIHQPEDSSLCGQCCVAMAAGVTLDRACQVIGHRRGTVTREIVRSLRELGIQCADRCHPMKRNIPVLPQRGLVVLHAPRGNRWHWMLTWDGKMYDPAGRWPSLDEWKITSYLEIRS